MDKTEKTTSILMIHEGEYPTVIEMYKTFQYLVNQFNISIVKKNSYKVKIEDVVKCDIVIGVRVHTPISYGVMKTALSSGKFVLYFLDDDLKDIPKGMFWYPKRTKWLLKCLRVSQGLITPNLLIGEEYRDFLGNERIALINTPVNCFKSNSYINDELVTRIVITGSEWHIGDYEKYLQPITKKIFEKYGDRISLDFVGFKPNSFDELANYKIKHYTKMPMEQYAEFMRNHHYDIGLAPLETNHFSERKYFNKFIEYTRYGVCGIYTKCKPYELVVKDEHNGFFSNNVPNDWYNTICKVIENPDLRKSCIYNAQKYLKEKHNEKAIFDALIRDFPEIVSYKSCENYERARISKDLLFYRLKYYTYKTKEGVYQTFNSIHHFGLKETVRKIKSKM